MEPGRRLTDVVMPQTTGTELVTDLRAEHPSLTVVSMSGHSHQLLTDEVLGHPASAFIEMPFTAEQLREKLSELLDG